MRKDTIAAIATPHGSGGVGIIRISGDNSAKICDRIYRGKSKIADFKPYLMQFGEIFSLDNELIDNVLCVYMKAPHSFTGEDTVEIHCHGGVFVTNRILEEVIMAGASYAMPGEFTKRAFLNGKMDLSQAEAVGDLIGAETNNALYEAVNRMEGTLSREINSIRDKILDITAQILVIADYPEEDIDEPKKQEFLLEITNLKNKAVELLNTSKAGKILKDGIVCAIVGRPNTGKSSLLNALSGENRAIVTDIEGTTRDAVEQKILINGIAVLLCDTAGIREQSGEIEKIGISISHDYIKKADICLAVLDSSYICEDDKKILELVKDKKHIVVLNKSDIANADFKCDSECVKISAKEGTGLSELCNLITEKVTDGAILSPKKAIITNLRQKEALSFAIENLNGAIDTINSGFGVDLAASDLENAAFSLGEITGMTVNDEIVDKIFSKFCLGK